jgi:Spy/CpxP family protein refolding chaperone
MTTMVRLTLVVIALAVFAATAFAQRGQGGMMRMGGMQNSGVFLLVRPDVQRDLDLTADQKAKLETIQQEATAQIRAMFEGMRDGGGGFDTMRETMEKFQAEVTKKAHAVLTDPQKKRVKEIEVQLQGNRAILNPDIQKDLGLTDEQKSKIKSLQSNLEAANQALMQDMRDGALDMQGARERMENNNKVLDTELGKVLTAEQSAKLKEMAGKPFKADDQNR